MVAYNFKRSFVADIRSRAKRQTIRLPRKRHARPGELVQLYEAMRTKHCRKIIPDPICTGLDEVIIDLRRLAGERLTPAALDDVLVVNGIPVRGEDAQAYARSDGFAGLNLRASGEPVPPLEHMIRWWMITHSCIRFEGVAIRWEDVV